MRSRFQERKRNGPIVVVVVVIIVIIYGEDDRYRNGNFPKVKWKCGQDPNDTYNILLYIPNARAS